MAEEPVPATANNVTDQVIRASWRRCATDYGFDRGFRHDVEMADLATIKEVKDSLDDVFATSENIVHRVRQIAKDVGYVILISDSGGVVIESFADCPVGREIAGEGLRKGSIWKESLVGTNGIGTAIMSRQALTVHGRAHYNNNFGNYTCSAAPIFSSDGKVIATIDLSGRAMSNSSEEYRFAEYFAREAAQNISMLLFRRQHQGDCLVALSGEPDPMPMSCRALIAANESGEILGATQEAFAILGIPELSDLGSHTIHDLWNVKLEDLKPLSAHNVPVQVSDGGTAYATAFLPKLKKSSSVHRAPRTNYIQPPPAEADTRKPLERVAGGDPRLRRIVNLCRQIANKDLPILILGETGVGKDTLARALHDESERRLRPYVAVNCAAIPATLLASELFGYTAGSFTGASRSGRVGKIQASDSGTLFLDEIGDMPLDLQAHLLRVLEERTVTPLGSTDSIPVDIKIICATHQNLPELVEAGKFRRDLYFRIKGVQVTLPSLRERKDLSELVEALAGEEARVSGQKIPEFSEDALMALEQYPWPGNIRELRSIIKLILSLYPNQKITVDELPEEVLQGAMSDADQGYLPPPPGSLPAYAMARQEPMIGDGTAPTTLSKANEAAEERLINEILRAQKWNVTNAAKQLGISRATLHRKIRKYGIVSPNNQG